MAHFAKIGIGAGKWLTFTSPLETRQGWAHIDGMDKIALPKIDQLVADAKVELKRLGIDTEGKRSDQILSMAREQRNSRRPSQSKP
jgi:hypothetical protein